MIKLSVLATSSAGNSTFLSSGRTRLLIDCGLNLQETTRRVEAIGEEIDLVSAVLLTHPHGDHCAGLPTLIRHWRRAGRHVPVYCSMATHDALPALIPPHWYKHVSQYDRWTVGDFQCETFPIEHDCGEPLGFTCQVDNVRLSFALDLGVIDDALGEYLARADVLFLEANHDPDMLAAGPYAYKLKQRIAKTHLSNGAAVRWITEHMTERTRHLLLGHLSVTTNDPELVRLSAMQALNGRGLDSGVLEVISPGEGPSGPLLLEQDRDKEH